MKIMATLFLGFPRMSTGWLGKYDIYEYANLSDLSDTHMMHMHEWKITEDRFCFFSTDLTKNLNVKLFKCVVLIVGVFSPIERGITRI